MPVVSNIQAQPVPATIEKDETEECSICPICNREKICTKLEEAFDDFFYCMDRQAEGGFGSLFWAWKTVSIQIFQILPLRGLESACGCDCDGP